MPSTISPLAEASRHRNSTGQALPPRLQRIVGVDISRIGIIPTPYMGPRELDRLSARIGWSVLLADGDWRLVAVVCRQGYLRVRFQLALVDQLQNRRHIIARFRIRRDA